MHRDHAQGSEARRVEVDDSPPSLFRGRAAWTEAKAAASSLRPPTADARGFATDFATRRPQQRPPAQDNSNDWQWAGNQAYATPDYESRGIYSPEQRWEAPASVFRPSSSTWTPSSSLNRPIRDDPYPVRGGAASSAVGAGQDKWADNAPRFSASARGRDAPPVWGFSTAGSASDMRPGAASSDRAGIGRQEAKAGRVALTHSPRHSQAQQKPPAPSGQQMQERQESTNFEQSELEAISRLSSERVRSRDREPPSGPASRTGSPLLSSLLDSPNTPSEGGEGKTSRYLREIDRRNILARIDSGEKQSELAKEFRVTRAAICNLKKHRDVILSRSHANPMAKHPKKSKLKPGNLQQSQERIGITSRTASSRSSSSASQKPIPSGPNALRKNPLVYQLTTRPTLLHFQRLSDPKADSVVFRRLCWRLMTLVTEEALAWVETTAFKRKSTKSSGMQSAKISEASTDSYESRDACAVVIKPEAYLFQQVFRSLDPDAPMGSIHFGDFGGASTTGPLSMSASMDVDVSLPPELASSHVYILHAIVPAVKSVWLAQALSALIERGAGDAFICLITLSIAAEAIGELQAAFPLLKIVTAHVDHATPDESNQMHDDYGDENNGHRRVVDRLAARIARDADTEAANG